MRIKGIMIFGAFIFLLFNSCSTKHYLVKNTKNEKIKVEQISIVNNNISKVIPTGVFPKYQDIEYSVISQRINYHNIDSLIYNELIRNNIKCKISNTQSIKSNSYYIKCQDYWAWDFKQYMPVLRIDIYNSNHNLVFSVVSEGNTAGLHDFPNPENQIPDLIKLLLTQTIIEN